MSVYLDFNASAPIDRRVLDYMVEIYSSTIGNADSRTHNFGMNAKSVVEHAREQVADLLRINKSEVVFTSGATESNNIAILGLERYGVEHSKKHIITSSIEHKSVLNACKEMQRRGFDVDFIDPDTSGRIKPEQIISRLRPDTLLVSIMHVNNETGVVQPVWELGKILAEKGILFHIDATQSFGKLVDELQEMQYNIMSMSAHKLGGPQGVGALILRKKRYKLPPVEGISYGGQQERGIRPGTVPVALVAGLGKACEISGSEYTENEVKAKAIKNEILRLLQKSEIKYKINGDQEHCVSTTLNVSFDGVSSEALMLSVKSFCGISNGSACNSNAYSPSYVLEAMHLPEEQISNAVRISWGSSSDLNEIKSSFESLLEKAKLLS